MDEEEFFLETKYFLRVELKPVCFCPDSSVGRAED